MTDEPKIAKQMFLRRVDPKLWHRLKVEAAERGCTMGEIVNEILRARYGGDAKTAAGN